MHVGKSLCQLNYTSRSNRSVFLSSCAVSNLHGAVVGIPKEFFPGGKRLCIELLMVYLRSTLGIF